MSTRSDRPGPCVLGPALDQAPRDALVTGQEVLTKGLKELSASSAEPGSSEEASWAPGEDMFTCSLREGTQADAGRAYLGLSQAGWEAPKELRPLALLSVSRLLFVVLVLII